MPTHKETILQGPSTKKRTIRQLYAKLRKEFAAADVQKYTVIEEGIPAEQVLAEMERVYHEESAKQRRKKR